MVVEILLGICWEVCGYLLEIFGSTLAETCGLDCAKLGVRFVENLEVRLSKRWGSIFGRLWGSFVEKSGVRLSAFYTRVQYYVCVCSSVALVRWIILMTFMLLSTFKFRSREHLLVLSN